MSQLGMNNLVKQTILVNSHATVPNVGLSEGSIDAEQNGISCEMKPGKPVTPDK